MATKPTIELDSRKVKILQLTEDWAIIWPSLRVSRCASAADALRAVKSADERAVQRTGRSRATVIEWQARTPDGWLAVRAAKEGA